MKFVIDKFVPYVAEVLAPYGEVVEIDGRSFPKELLDDADGLIVRTRTRCDEGLIGGAKRLKFVGTATIGYDHIDRPYLASRGIDFTSAAGCNSRAVLQWVAAALAHLAANGHWTPQERTLGVVGVGHVGSLVVEYARSWGFEVLCSDPPREQAEGIGRAEGFVPLAELLSRSDIVTLHTPLTHTGEWPTYHLVDSNFLAQMRDGATLLNASRGEVADSVALLANAHRTTLCIDTWEGEPDNINPTLLEVTEIATPHIAGYSAQGKANASAIVIDALANSLGLEGLKGWYPSDVKPSAPRPISWEAMCAQIGSHCDLISESRRMKEHPEDFEHRRNTYPLREEFF